MRRAARARTRAMDQPLELRPLSGRRILYFSLVGLGDIVHDQLLFALLRRHDPEAVVDVVAPRAAEALFARMEQVGRLWPRPPKGTAALGQRARFVRAIRGRYAQSIVVSKSLKAALLPFAARIPVRTGFANAELPLLFNDIRAPARRDERKEQVLRLAPRGMALPEPLPLPALQHDPEQARAAMRTHGLDPEAPWVALAPGASGSDVRGRHKRWGRERFAALARHLARAGYRPVALGMACDRARGAAIAQAAPGAVSLCGATTLDAACDILGQCRLAVCNDSGLLHVASALGTPALGIYGATPADGTPVRAPWFAAVVSNAPCAPCRRLSCPYGSYACMQRIDAAAVAETALGVLQAA